MPDAGIDHLLEFLHYLSTNGCGTIGVGLRANAVVETTGPGLFVIEIPGLGPQITMSTGSYVRKPRFRIESRSTAPGPDQVDYPDITNARNLIQTAYQACLSVGDTSMASTGVAPSTGLWLWAIPESEPSLAGRDGKDRVVFRFDVGCARQGK